MFLTSRCFSWWQMFLHKHLAERLDSRHPSSHQTVQSGPFYCFIWHKRLCLTILSLVRWQPSIERWWWWLKFKAKNFLKKLLHLVFISPPADSVFPIPEMGTSLGFYTDIYSLQIGDSFAVFFSCHCLVATLIWWSLLILSWEFWCLFTYSK